MKTKIVFLILISGITVAFADLTLELNLTNPKMKIVVKVKGEKIRYDLLPDGGYGNMSRIVNLNTGDSFILDHVPKRIVNHPFIPHDYTNAILKAEWPKLQNTYKTERLNGYKAEIYELRNADNMPETLWLAENYPNFDEIKIDLAKLDFGKLDNKKMWMPNLGSLSGMPLKLLLLAHNNSATNEIDISLTLALAKEGSIDDSVFELPKDYHFQNSTSFANTNAVANTNEFISVTNEMNEH